MINYTCYTPKSIPSQDLVSRSEKKLKYFLMGLDSGSYESSKVEP